MANLTSAAQLSGDQKQTSIRVLLRSSLVALVMLQFTNVAVAQTLGTPPNITDSYNAANQVGGCISQYGANSCTANDFRITTIDIVNIDDGCSSPSDYMQVDALVSFRKATPARYDIMAWFYRGDDQSVAPTPNFLLENAINGGFCNRIGLQNGLAITGSTLTSGSLDLPNPTGDACFDVPNTAPGNLVQQIDDLVLPCRDIGIPNTTDPSLPVTPTPDGQVDISGCTSWDNNRNTICSGPEYDGVTEPAVGTPSKCNCGEFSGITLQVGIPNVSVNKVCTPTSLEPGETTSCTITITNTGTGPQTGATGPGAEGFFYEDDYPEAQGSVSNIVTSQGSAIDGFTVDATGASTTNQSINIYPGDIAALTGIVTVTYDFTTSPSLPNTLTNITNTVCASYYDTGTDGSTEVFSYAFDANLCDTQVVTTPVTLADFSARAEAGGLQFAWVTATETNNIGFNIYAKHGHTLFKLNEELIPSHSVSTLDESVYGFWVEAQDGLLGRQFYLEDIDIEGTATKHGPFTLSNKPLRVQANAQKTDWIAIKQKNKARKLQKSGFKAKAGNRVLSESVLSTDLINFNVFESGPQRVTFADLDAAGFSSKLIMQGRYRLTDKTGREIPSRVFKKAGFMEFIATADKTFYSSENTYQLRVADKPRSALTIQRSPKQSLKGVSTADFYLHTEVLESDEVYVNSSKISNDPWMMHRLFAIRNPKTVDFSIPVSAVYEGDAEATVSIEVAGGINVPDQDDRRLSLTIGSQILQQAVFDGTDSAHLQGAIALESDATEAVVSLTTEPLNSYRVDIAYTNKVTVQYPREFVAINDALTFESSAPAFKVRGLSGTTARVYARGEAGDIFLGRYRIKGGQISFAAIEDATKYYAIAEDAVPAPEVEAIIDVTPTKTGQPNLVIAHEDFVTAELNDYLLKREQLNRGGSTVVTTKAIYQQYSGGVRDAEAIHQYIREYAATNQLNSILLIGGDVYDYHDNLSIGAVSYLPTLYRATGDYIQFSPVDALYGDVDYDGVQDVPLGRLPVRTADELAIVLDKSFTFADQRGEIQSALLIADEQGSIGAYDFARSSDNVAAVLEPEGWGIERAYVDQLGVAGARDALLEGLNNGPRFALYTGHSSPSSWSGKQIFTYQDTLGLSNIERPGAYVQWGCYNTYFSSPTADSMSHGLMLAGQQGAAVVVGSSTLTDANAESRFAVLVQNAMIESKLGFGEALIVAKREFFRQTGFTYKGILWGVALLGDPLLTL